MPKPLRDLVSTKAIGAYWYDSHSNTLPYLGRALFPQVKKNGLTMKYFKGYKGLPILLKPSALDADVTFRQRLGVESIETDMPFFREGHFLSEQEEYRYNEIRNAGDAYVNEILTRVYDDFSGLIDSADVNPEIMIWQLLAPIDGSPKIKIASNELAYDYSFDADGTYKATHFTELTGADMWSDPKADVIGDIQTIVTNAREKYGINLTRMVMTTKTLNFLVKNEGIRGIVLAQNLTANIYMTVKLVKTLIKEMFDLDIITYDKLYKNGENKDTKYYPEGMVTFLPSGTIGNTCYGTTPEELNIGVQGSDISIVNVGVALNKVVKPFAPFQTTISASEVVMPSFERMEEVFIAKVATTE